MAARKKRSPRKPVRRRKAAKAAPRRVKRSRPETLRLRSATPSFTVNDIEKSLAWYRDCLGFTVGETWSEGGRLMGAELKAGTVALWLGQDDWKKGRDRLKGSGFRTYLTTVQDIDEIAARVKRAGGVLDHEPQDQPWGVRDIGVKDPDGFALTIQRELKKRR